VGDETVLAGTLGTTELNPADDRSLQVLQEQHGGAIDEEDDAEEGCIADLSAESHG
jgi:hypothetical protein